MKKILQKTLMLAVVALGFTSCNDDGGIPERNTEKIARFQSGVQEIETEEYSTEIIELPVYINYVSEQPVTIFYEITGNTDAVENLSANSGEVVIPTGEKTGVILLKPIDNDEINDGVHQVKVMITGAEGGYNLPDDMPIGFETKTIYFKDDECPIDPSLSYEASVFAFNEQADSFTPTLVLVNGTTNSYEVDSGWGPNFVAWATGNPAYEGSYVYPGILTINDDLTVTFEGTEFYTTGGSGTYDPCEDVVEMELTQGLFTSDFTVNVTYNLN